MDSGDSLGEAAHWRFEGVLVSQSGVSQPGSSAPNRLTCVHAVTPAPPLGPVRRSRRSRRARENKAVSDQEWQLANLAPVQLRHAVGPKREHCTSLSRSPLLEATRMPPAPANPPEWLAREQRHFAHSAAVQLAHLVGSQHHVALSASPCQQRRGASLAPRLQLEQQLEPELVWTQEIRGSRSKAGMCRRRRGGSWGHRIDRESHELSSGDPRPNELARAQGHVFGERRLHTSRPPRSILGKSNPPPEAP